MTSTNADRSQLLLASFLGLFFELALIRFINSTVQVVAYFNNFLILSAFLGLGFGSYLVPRKRDLFRLLPLLVPLVLFAVLAVERAGYRAKVADQVYWTPSSDKAMSLPVPAAMLLVFCANCALFIPIGYRIGDALRRFSNRLEAYGWDLAGSLAGVLAFTAVSFLGTPPWVWFTIGGLVAVALLVMGGAGWIERGLAVLLMGSAVFLSSTPKPGFWSPYYKINFAEYRFDGEPLGYAVVVDQLRIQDALRFSPALLRSPLAPWIDYYRLPYLLRAPGRVLILGGGSGNDAAMALRFSPASVDVVEIDPVLVAAGHELHPERPYANPKVRAVVDDGRAFLSSGSGTYDLIVMNAVDSHHQLPGLSTLRLESYLYTVQAFEHARRRLAPNGIFIVHLSSTREWMGQRLFASLTKAFGKEPRLFTTRRSPFKSIAFVYGPDEVLDHPRGAVMPVPVTEKIRAATPLATDDWPQLYLRDKRIPIIYLQALGLVALFSFAILFRSVFRLGRSSNLLMFLLGAGFMLLETRSLTQSALLFGATWVVSAIVIGTILIMVLIGNLIVARGLAPRKAVCWAGLFVTLAIGYVLDPALFLRFAFLPRLLLGALWIGTPIFFASLIFSNSFRDVPETATAFGANLLGVVVGGALEYSSMMWGLDSLYITTAVLYALALAADARGSSGARGRMSPSGGADWGILDSE